MTASWVCAPPLVELVSLYWCKQPLWSPPAVERLDRLRGSGAFTLDAFLDGVTGPVIANLQRPDHPHEQVEVTAGEAARLYAAGLSLYITDVPVLRWAADELADVLGVPRERARASIFASRRGNRTAGHFDVNDGFAIQLTGHKRWTVAANEHVVHPVNNWLGNDRLHADLRYYLDRALPDAMPTGGAVFELEPGASLYVPRGSWHSTETLAGDAFSLDLALRPPCWYELLLDRVHALALANPAWRATAVRGPDGEDPQILGRLLGELSAMLGALDPELALARPGSAGAPPAAGELRRYQRNPFARLVVEDPGSPDRAARIAIVFRTLDGDDDTGFSLDDDSFAIARWVAARSPADRITADDVVALGYLTDRDDVAAFLHDLAAAGLLRATA